MENNTTEPLENLIGRGGVFLFQAFIIMLTVYLIQSSKRFSPTFTRRLLPVLAVVGFAVSEVVYAGLEPIGNLSQRITVEPKS